MHPDHATAQVQNNVAKIVRDRSYQRMSTKHLTLKCHYQQAKRAFTSTLVNPKGK